MIRSHFGILLAAGLAVSTLVLASVIAPSAAATDGGSTASAGTGARKVFPRMKGIHPDLRAQYRADTFKCLDGSQTIPRDWVNDDFCDCPDGSDEPGTSACPNGHFWCANRGFKGMYIPSAQVGDGVCDCCDGSDESDQAHPLISCPNRCLTVAKDAMKGAEEELDALKKGLAARTRLVEEAAAARTRLTEEQGSNKMKLEEVAARIKVLEEKDGAWKKEEEERQRILKEQADREAAARAAVQAAADAAAAAAAALAPPPPLAVPAAPSFAQAVAQLDGQGNSAAVPPSSPAVVPPSPPPPPSPAPPPPPTPAPAPAGTRAGC